MLCYLNFVCPGRLISLNISIQSYKLNENGEITELNFTDLIHPIELGDVILNLCEE